MKGEGVLWLAGIIILAAVANKYFPVLAYFMAMFLDGPVPR